MIKDLVHEAKAKTFMRCPQGSSRPRGQQDCCSVTEARVCEQLAVELLYESEQHGGMLHLRPHL